MVFAKLISVLSLLPFLAQAALPRLGGINLSGLEWGTDIWGGVYQSFSTLWSPPTSQIKHFAGQNVNLFRLPFAWQYLQPTINGDFNSTYAALLDSYITQTTAAGAYTIVDLHNYARRQSNVVGESNALPASALADLWKRLAQKYKGNDKVIFGLMNEPHDLTLSTWIATVQTVVTAIRKTGAKNTILMPGDNWTGLAAFSSWYYAGLNNVQNPDGTTDNLVFDIHRYLDSAGSGTTTECASDRTTEIAAAVQILKSDKRQAILSETGGGNTASCETMLPALLTAVNNAYPYFAGWSAWAAGSFQPTYELTLVPHGGSDTPLWNKIKPLLPASAGHHKRRLD